MGLQCSAHQKSFVGSCQLCGTQMCKLCVGKSKGARLWCLACTKKLNSFPDLRVHQHKEEEVLLDHDAHWYYDDEAHIKAKPRASEKSYQDKFGYFDFQSLSKNKKV